MSNHLHYIQEFPCNVINPPIYSRKWFGLFFPFSSSNNLSATKWSYSWLKTGWAFSICPNFLVWHLSSATTCIHHFFFSCLQNTAPWTSRKHRNSEDQQGRKLNLYIQQSRLPHAVVQPVWHQLGYIPGGIWVHVPAGGIPGITGRVNLPHFRSVQVDGQL